MKTWNGSWTMWKRLIYGHQSKETDYSGISADRLEGSVLRFYAAFFISTSRSTHSDIVGLESWLTLGAREDILMQEAQIRNYTTDVDRAAAGTPRTDA